MKMPVSFFPVAAWRIVLEIVPDVLRAIASDSYDAGAAVGGFQSEWFCGFAGISSLCAGSAANPRHANPDGAPESGVPAPKPSMHSAADLTAVWSALSLRAHEKPQ
jgi:hypothetical protein